LQSFDLAFCWFGDLLSRPLRAIIYAS